MLFVGLWDDPFHDKILRIQNCITQDAADFLTNKDVFLQEYLGHLSVVFRMMRNEEDDLELEMRAAEEF